MSGLSLMRIGIGGGPDESQIGGRSDSRINGCAVHGPERDRRGNSFSGLVRANVTGAVDTSAPSSRDHHRVVSVRIFQASFAQSRLTLMTDAAEPADSRCAARGALPGTGARARP